MNDHERTERLNTLRGIYELRSLTQEEIAKFLGVSREMFNKWLNATKQSNKDIIKPSQVKWRERFIDLLVEFLNLKTDHQQFHKIWNMVMVEVWHWDALTDEEIAKYNLAPPIELYINVPSRQQHLSITGRNTLLADLRQRLLTLESFALTGMPGVGKTALVIELVRDYEVMKFYENAIVWIRMGSSPNIFYELSNLAKELGLDVDKLISEAKSKTEEALIHILKEAIKNAIGRRRFLIVVDDAWELGSANIFNFDGPNCCLVLTTRKEGIARSFFANRSTARGKVIVVPELEYEADENPAFELLNQFAPEVCSIDPEAARTLVKTVGGLPLALVLLGGYLGDPERIHVPTEIKLSFLKKMEDPQSRLQLAQARLGAISDRKLTLQAIIELSLEDLQKHSSNAFQAFYALGSFASKPDRFDWDAAQFVTEVDALTLGILIARYLLERDQQEQLAIHQVLADVARTKTTASSRARHQLFYVTLVNKDAEDWRVIDKVYGQIKWAWEGISANKELVGFLDALSAYQARRHLWSDREKWLKRAIYLAKASKDKEIAKLIGQLGDCYTHQERLNEAVKLFKTSLALSQKIENHEIESYVLNSLGTVYAKQGNLDDAIRLYEQSLQIKQGLKDYRQASTLNNLGLMYVERGNLDKAKASYEESLAIAKEVGDREGQALSLMNLGVLFFKQADVDRAKATYEESLAIFKEIGHREDEVLNLLNLANAYRQLRELDTAIRLYEQTLTIAKELNYEHGIAAALNNMSFVFLEKKRLDDAREGFMNSLAIFQKLGDPQSEGLSILNLGTVHLEQRSYDKAIEKYEESLVIFKQIGDPHNEALSIMNIGYAYSKQKRFDKAIEKYQQSLALCKATGNRHGETELFRLVEITYNSIPYDSLNVIDIKSQLWQLLQKIKKNIF